MTLRLIGAGPQTRVGSIASVLRPWPLHVDPRRSRGEVAFRRVIDTTADARVRLISLLHATDVWTSDPFSLFARVFVDPWLS